MASNVNNTYNSSSEVRVASDSQALRNDSSSNNSSPNDGAEEGGGFSPFVATCFTLNYIIGSGFLTLPWAFVQAGIGAGASTLILFALFTSLAVILILQVTNRAERFNSIISKRNSNLTKQAISLTSIRSGGDSEAVKGPRSQSGYSALANSTDQVDEVESSYDQSNMELEDDNDCVTFGLNSSSEASDSNFNKETKRKFEVNELCEIFLGMFVDSIIFK